MRVVICGAGQVGFGIAERLAAEQNDVSVVDTSPKLVARIRDTLDVRGFVGNGAQPEVLAQAGAADADMIIAVTLSDEVNMVACQVAHSLFRVPTKVARIRAQGYLAPQWADLFTTDHLPIDVIISPEIEVGEMVLRRLSFPGAVDIVRFADGKVIVLGVPLREDCPVVDTPLRQLSDLFPDLGATVVGIRRGDKVTVPTVTDQMRVGDIAYVVVKVDQVRRMMKIFGHQDPEASRIVIAGGGNIGLYVATKIEEKNPNARVTVVEASRERSVDISDELKRSTILNGSALDHDILAEADVADADTMVALTNDDEVNILSCVMARNLGARRTLSLINNLSYPSLAKSLGIDAYVNPRTVTVSTILRHVRRGRIRGVHSLQDGAAEIMEAEAMETSPLVGKPLRDLDLPNGVRIGAIYRGGKVIAPDGEARIAAKDRVIVFALAGKVKTVEQLFRVSLEFF
jgi:trk system potassium uptake protein TrkA